MTSEFSKYFNGFKKSLDELPLPMPSTLIPKEIARWELYRKLVGHRTHKHLIADKGQFVKYLYGDTMPMARAYEANMQRTKFLNPMYNPETNEFSHWKTIAYLVGMIGENYEKYTVKAGLMSALRDYIQDLKSLDLNQLDTRARAYDSDLLKKRKTVIAAHVASKTYLLSFPHNLTEGFAK